MFNRKSHKAVMTSSEMDLKPFMNLMVVLIPMLLVSAEFAKVAVIDIKLPEGGSDTHKKETENTNQKDNKLSLTAIITDSALTIAAKGGFMPSIQYREYHQYTAKDDQTQFVVPYEPGVMPKHPVNGREMNVYERSDIYIYMCDENHNIVNSYYTKNSELLVNAVGEPVTKIFKGDTVFTSDLHRRAVVVSDIKDLELRPLSVYDELQNRLLKIKERYNDVIDGNTITIAAENGVLYDKVVQIMDKARASDYSNISISKLRG